MSQKILVTYASRTGTTAEYAETIAQTLRESNLAVDIQPMQAVQNLTPYTAVIAGSAIRGSKWLPEAVDFIRTHRAELAQKRFAMFTVCITLAMSNTEQYRAGVSKWVQPVRAMVAPIREGFFPGRLDFNKLPFNWDTLMLRLTVALGIFPKGDRKDLNAAKTWAGDLANLLSR